MAYDSEILYPELPPFLVANIYRLETLLEMRRAVQSGSGSGGSHSRSAPTHKCTNGTNGMSSTDTASIGSGSRSDSSERERARSPIVSKGSSDLRRDCSRSTESVSSRATSMISCKSDMATVEVETRLEDTGECVSNEVACLETIFEDTGECVSDEAACLETIFEDTAECVSTEEACMETILDDCLVESENSEDEADLTAVKIVGPLTNIIVKEHGEDVLVLQIPNKGSRAFITLEVKIMSPCITLMDSGS